MTSLKDLLDYTCSSDSPVIVEKEADQAKPAHGNITLLENNPSADGDILPETLDSDDPGWDSPTESVGRKYVPPVRTSMKKAKPDDEDSDEEKETVKRTVRSPSKDRAKYIKLGATGEAGYKTLKERNLTRFNITFNGLAPDREPEIMHSDNNQTNSGSKKRVNNNSKKWKNSKRKFEKTSYGL